MTHLKPRDTYKLKGRGKKRIFHANRDKKKAGIAIFISDKIDFDMTMTRDKVGHHIIIKETIKEDVTIINIYAPKHRSTTICKANANKYERGN